MRSCHSDPGPPLALSIVLRAALLLPDVDGWLQPISLEEMVPWLIQFSKPFGGQNSLTVMYPASLAFNPEKSLGGEKPVSKGGSVRDRAGPRWAPTEWSQFSALPV